MGKFTITKKATGQFYFNLKANNGMVILGSEGYTSKPDCKKGIESVMRHSANETMFDRKKASNGKYYFNLKAANGQIIGTSQMYVTAFALEKGIASVAKNALQAPVEDRSLRMAIV